MLKKNQQPTYTPDMHFESMLKEAVETSRNNTVEIAKLGIEVRVVGDDISDIKDLMHEQNGRMEGWQNTMVTVWEDRETRMKKSFTTSGEHNALKGEVGGVKKIVWWGMGILSAVIVAVATMLLQIILK